MHGLNGIVKSLNCFPTLQEKLSIVFFCQFPKLTEVVSMFLVSFSRGGSRIFFRTGCTRLLLYFNTNKPHRFFLAEYQLYKKSAGHLGGGGLRTPCTFPLDPPLFSVVGTENGRQVVRRCKSRKRCVSYNYSYFQVFYYLQGHQS